MPRPELRITPTGQSRHHLSASIRRKFEHKAEQKTDSSNMDRMGSKFEQKAEHKAEADAITDKMRNNMVSRLGEVEAMMRVSFGDDHEVSRVRKEIRECMQFLHALEHAAKTHNVLQGAAFQELLASIGPSVKNPRPIRTPKAKVKCNCVCFQDPAVATKMAMQAENLIELVRVKIEDDNDLRLARTCLRDATAFFQEADRCACRKNISIFTYIESLRN